jgi:ABC-type antimicrobial peptide transport system permease subunit
MIYWSFEQFNTFNFMTVIARTAGDPLVAAPALREAVRALDPLLPVYDVKPMSARFSESITRARFAAASLGFFAAVALALACVGIYGVMSYVTGQRVQEFGIRMALGAARREVLWLVLRQGARLVGAALAIGIIAAFLVTRLLGGLVVGIGRTDAVTYISTSLLLALTALLACWLPARRAAAIDPIRAMRQD